MFDAHCHLQDDRIVGDLDKILADSRKQGVDQFYACGTCEQDWDSLAELASKHSQIRPFFGIHPWWISGRSQQWKQKLLGHIDSDGEGIGEIGLDYALDGVDRQTQIEIFKEQYRISIDFKTPVSIHCRRAWGDMPGILRSYGSHPAGAILHSYSGLAEIVSQLKGLNILFSFSGSITNLNNKRAAESVRAAPLEQILIETDSPDMSPRIDGEQSQGPNTPANLPLVLERVAELKMVDPAEMAETIFRNRLL